MNYLHNLFNEAPLLALFITISLGYLVGKFKIKRFVLGGIAGSLLVGVIIGQTGIKIPESIGTIFFALFIYAVGYQGGPQFFKSLNRKTLVQLISATITCVLGLLCVLAAAWIFHLDRGTAAGLAAGGLTQSAIIGTASDAIAKLGLSAHATQVMQSNIAVGYAVCYIFGSFGPILLLTAIFPGMMKWDLRKEAKELATSKGAGKSILSPGQFNAIREVTTRIYSITAGSTVIGKSIYTIAEGEARLSIGALVRNNEAVMIQPDTLLREGDIVAVTARPKAFSKQSQLFGPEVPAPKKMVLIEETRKVVLTNKEYDNKTIRECFGRVAEKNFHGVFVSAISHLGEKIAPTPDQKLQRGDELELVGRSADLDKVASSFGSTISSAKLTSFIFFGLGMALGVWFGLFTFRIFDISITLGTGAGCLFSGLIFGWLRSRYPRCGSLPVGASNFLRDFGLAVFVSVIGITAGPQAVTTIEHYGAQLFLLGVGVTIIPQIITFYISYYILKIKNPIILLSTIAGGRSANPGFAALLDKAGNSTPVVPFTATYAVANIFLTLWGPVIIALVTKNV